MTLMVTVRLTTTVTLTTAKDNMSEDAGYGYEGDGQYNDNDANGYGDDDRINMIIMILNTDKNNDSIRCALYFSPSAVQSVKVCGQLHQAARRAARHDQASWATVLSMRESV